MAGFRLGAKKERSWDVARGRFQRSFQTVRARQLAAIRRAALLAERELKKGLAAGAPGGQTLKPLSPLTVLMRKKGSSRPLLDHGDLLGAITTTIDKDTATAFVGINRTAQTSDGRLLMNLALIHEFGTEPYVIPVTPALRRFWRALVIKSGGTVHPLRADTTELHHPGVPPRPFMAPTLEAIKDKLPNEVKIAFEDGPI